MGRPRIRPLGVAMAALLLLGPLVVLEVGVRLLIESDRLPEATSSQELTDVGLANLARSGRPDILVLGNSAIRNGLQPDVLEALIAEAGGGEVRVQGIAQGAMSLEAQELLVRALAERGQLPSTVLVGLTAGTLNGSLDDAEGQAEDWFTASELGQLWSGCAGLAWPEVSDCRLGELSALWRWRGRPDRLVSAALRGMPTTFDHDGRVLQENGWASEEPATARRLREQLPGTLERLPALGDGAGGRRGALQRPRRRAAGPGGQRRGLRAALLAAPDRGAAGRRPGLAGAAARGLRGPGGVGGPGHQRRGGLRPVVGAGLAARPAPPQPRGRRAGHQAALGACPASGRPCWRASPALPDGDRATRRARDHASAAPRGQVPNALDEAAEERVDVRVHRDGHVGLAGPRHVASRRPSRRSSSGLPARPRRRGPPCVPGTGRGRRPPPGHRG